MKGHFPEVHLGGTYPLGGRTPWGDVPLVLFCSEGPV